MAKNCHEFENFSSFYIAGARFIRRGTQVEPSAYDTYGFLCSSCGCHIEADADRDSPIELGCEYIKVSFCPNCGEGIEDDRNAD